MHKLIYLLIIVPLIVNAQEDCKLRDIKDVKFYDLKNAGCSVDSISSNLKSITLKTSPWKNILLSARNASKDIAKESSCYIILVSFKSGASIPFKLYPDQKVLFDMRENHFNYLSLSDKDGRKMNQLIKDAIKCLNDPVCKSVD